MLKQIRKAVKNVKRLVMTGYTYGFVYHVGHVGCCDSSKNKHATKHFKATEHSIIKSFEPGEDWKWCYVSDMLSLFLYSQQVLIALLSVLYQDK